MSRQLHDKNIEGEQKYPELLPEEDDMAATRILDRTLLVLYYIAKKILLTYNDLYAKSLCSTQ